MTEQERIQVWNDAVTACKRAAWLEVEAMEQEARNGMPHPARSVVRAVGSQIIQGDDRNVIHGLSVDDFPRHTGR